jgi:hypothetical protein
MLSTPLTKLDACLGHRRRRRGSLDQRRARAGAAPRAALVLGAGEAHHHRNISQMPDLTTTARSTRAPRLRDGGASAAGRRRRRGLRRLHDQHDPLPRGPRFCARARAGPFVAGGRIAPGGALAVNTNGGGLSYCHPGMYGIFLLIEAVRRIRAGDDVVVAHGNGGVLSAQATVVLGSAATV